MVAFYKHNIPQWRGGTAKLSDRAYRVYHVLVEEMMLQEGPFVLHERSLAGLSNRSTRDLRAALSELCGVGKIRIEDGKVYNERAEKELVAIHSNRENAAKGGRKVREHSANGPRMVDEHSSNDPRKGDEPPATRNNFKGVSEAPLGLPNKPKREEKSREESVATHTREDEIDLSKKLVAAYMQAGKPVPAMHQVGIWLAQGYEPGLIVSVIAARLQTLTKHVSLSWFDSAIAEAHAKRAPKPAAANADLIDIGLPQKVHRQILARAITRWLRDPAQWDATLGPPPKTTLCKIPKTLIEELEAAA